MKEKMNATDMEQTNLVAEEISKNKKIKKADKKNTKKDKKEKKVGFFASVKDEMKKVSWPSFKDVLKYSIATLAFCVIVAGFFILLNLLLSGVKGLFV